MKIGSFFIILILHASIAMSQNTAHDFFKIGKEFENQNKYEEAIEHFTKALDIDSNFVDAYYERALAKFNKKSQDYVGAVRDLDEVLLRNPNKKWALSYRADFKYAAENYTEAIEDYNKLIRQNPTRFVFFFRRGKARMMLERYDEALSDFKMTGEISEGFDAIYLSSLIHLRIKNYDSAAILLKEVSKYHTFYRDTWLLSSLAEYKKLNFEEAICSAEKAIQFYEYIIKSSEEEYFIKDERFGDKVLYQIYSQDVINGFSEELITKEIEPLDKLLSGLILVYKQKFNSAKQEFDKAIQLRKRDSKPYFWRGKMSLELKNYTDALQDFDKAIKLNKQYADAYFNRALTHLEMDVFDNVCNDLLKARELGNTKAASWYESGCN